MGATNTVRVIIAACILLIAAVPVDAARLVGKVTDVTRTAEGTVHVKLKTGDATVEACLGSREYLVRNGFLPRIGEQIEVEGGYDNPDNPTVLIAKQIRLKGQTLALRDHPSPPHPPAPSK